MAPAEYDQVRVSIAAGSYTFKATGSSLLFPGFLLLYRSAESEEEKVLPPLAEGQELTMVEFLPEQHFTQPPPRYTEASLVKTLEEKGIGRPSTYVRSLKPFKAAATWKGKQGFCSHGLGFVIVDLLKSISPKSWMWALPRRWSPGWMRLKRAKSSA